MGVKEVLNYFGIVDMYLYFRLIRPGLTYPILSQGSC